MLTAHKSWASTKRSCMEVILVLKILKNTSRFQFSNLIGRENVISIRVIEMCVIWEGTAKCDGELEPEQKYRA